MDQSWSGKQRLNLKDSLSLWNCLGTIIMQTNRLLIHFKWFHFIFHGVFISCPLSTPWGIILILRKGLGGRRWSGKLSDVPVRPATGHPYIVIPTLSEEGNSHLDSGFLGAHSLRPQTITFQLLQQEPPKRSPLMPVFFFFFFLCKNSYNPPPPPLSSPNLPTSCRQFNRQI